ncbi:MAG TPA: hypothetical protein VL992_18485 [Tepidisphaeraceae bacterium]|nr:hypothetical protein [Tepidisphaeraceae bacterium]
MERSAKSSIASDRRLLLAGWAFIALSFAFCIPRLMRIGLDLRHDLWTYVRDSRQYGDINSGLSSGSDVLRAARRAAGNQRRPGTIAHPGPGFFDSPLTLSNFAERWHRLIPLYGQVLRAWVDTYHHLQTERPNGDYEMDYPPMRLLVMTLWAWHVQEHFPHQAQLPDKPSRVIDAVTGSRAVLNDEIASPVLALNTACSGIAAVAGFALVLLWVNRAHRSPIQLSWRDRWGSPLLLIPAAALGVFLLGQMICTWRLSGLNPASLTPIDRRVTSLPWLMLMLLRFLAVVSLARFLPHPFRGAACGLVAGTMFWLSPAMMIDSHVWPQWDVWLLPFFTIAALLASLNCWLIAGWIIGIGCMFKGQLLFGAPVLIFCPIVAGQPLKFVRVLIGLFAGAATVVWPWLLAAAQVRGYLIAVTAAIMVIGGIAFFRGGLTKKLGRWATWGMAVPTAVVLAVWVQLMFLHSLSWWAAILLAAALSVGWWLSRRGLAIWSLGTIVGAIWLAAFNLGGDFSWWTVGFAYGTVRHDQEMQLGGGLWSNLPAILQERYGWHIHDPVGSLDLPRLGIRWDLDLRQALGLICIGAILLCAIGAGIQFRRRDPRFLIALTAPWAIFPVLLPQMSARYFILPAAISALLIGVSTSWAMLHLLIAWMSCATIALRIWPQPPGIAPVTQTILARTHPDMGWALLLVAAILAVGSVAPPRRGSG